MDQLSFPAAINALMLKDWINQGADIDIVDVREPWEHALCLIPGSMCIPLGTLPDRIDIINPDRITVFVCHHGGRSARAIEWLKNNGYEKLVNLQGGIDDWSVDVDKSMARY